MTFKNIQEKYPHAFKFFFNHYWEKSKVEFTKDGDLYFYEAEDGGKSVSVWNISLKEIIELRRWFDFFDEQRIYHNIS